MIGGAIGCALAAAVSNAFATVVQRRAARRVPAGDTMRLVLIKHLMRQPRWYAGMAGLIGGFAGQAAALSMAGLALVQPVISVELPITLLFAARVFRRRIDRHAMSGMLAVSAGLATLITSMDPTGGRQPTDGWAWLWAGVISVGTLAGLLLAGWALPGSPRATLFGAASGLAFGCTAALMKGALGQLSAGFLALATSWQLYVMIVAGVLGVYLTQNTLQAGPLVAGQPAITAGEPLTSILFGVLLFHESVRLGLWLIPTLVGCGLLATGSVLLARSPLSTAGTERGSSEPRPVSNSGDQ